MIKSLRLRRLCRRPRLRAPAQPPGIPLAFTSAPSSPTAGQAPPESFTRCPALATVPEDPAPRPASRRAQRQNDPFPHLGGRSPRCHASRATLTAAPLPVDPNMIRWLEDLHHYTRYRIAVLPLHKTPEAGIALEDVLALSIVSSTSTSVTSVLAAKS